MAYSQSQLFEIAKKLIIFSGKKGVASPGEKKKIIPHLNDFLFKIEDDSSLMGGKVKKFIIDIISDLENDRLIDIDAIEEDNYIENFLQAESFVFMYNSLLKHTDYTSIILSIKNNEIPKIYEIVSELKNQVNKTIKLIDIQRFTELLLIINIFKISHILKHYSEIYAYLLESNDYKTAQEILEIIILVQKFHIEIHRAAFKKIETQNIELYYMMCDIKNNKLSFLPTKVIKESHMIREYKKILVEKFLI